MYLLRENLLWKGLLPYRHSLPHCPDTHLDQLALRMLLLGRHHRPVLGSSNSVQGLPGTVSEYEPSNLGVGRWGAARQLKLDLCLCHLSSLDSSVPCLTTGEQPDASLPLHVLPLYSLLAPEKQAQVMGSLLRALGWGGSSLKCFSIYFLTSPGSGGNDRNHS